MRNYCLFEKLMALTMVSATVFVLACTPSHQSAENSNRGPSALPAESGLTAELEEYTPAKTRAERAPADPHTSLVKPFDDSMRPVFFTATRTKPRSSRSCLTG